MTNQLETTAIIADAERILADAWRQHAARQRIAERRRRLLVELDELDAVPDWYVWALCALAVVLAAVGIVAGWL